MSINNGDMPTTPILASPPTDSYGRSIEHDDSYYATGLTKREHFAALAMQGILGAGYTSHEQSVPSVSVRLADALLKELDK